MIVVISSCSASKDDSVPIPDSASRMFPAEYLGDTDLVRRLNETRDAIFKDPRSAVGTKTTYAFDLYVQTGNAYRHSVNCYRNKLKALMISGKLSWFFLSGGYGIVHALEPVQKYQATFNRTISHQNGIPFTANLWKGILSDMIDSAVLKLDPEWIFFFGSQDYSTFFKESKVGCSKRNLRLFESTGSCGPYWLSPIISKLAASIVEGQVEKFGKNYSCLTKQVATKR